MSGDALPGALFDCDEELPGLLATLNMIHGEHLALSYRAPPGLQLPWDREDLLELLGNLLDNACKWADAEVRLSVVETADGFELSVEDDGPGIPEDQRAQVFSRGTRLDEQTDGHGLGLGIVRDIVDSVGRGVAVGRERVGRVEGRDRTPQTLTDPVPRAPRGSVPAMMDAAAHRWSEAPLTTLAPTVDWGRYPGQTRN